MPMLQEDIRRHYESTWQKTNTDAAATGLRYSSPVEDAVLYPAYERLIGDLQLINDGTRLLDVGAGSGRWIRFFSERYRPARIVGVDFAEASVRLLREHYGQLPHSQARFDVCDITRPELDLGETFDLINIANVLFHIPEPDRFGSAMRNLAAHLAPGGRIVTTEYLPRVTMRTEWMLVRSRYEFAAAVEAAGLKIVDTRAFCFFANDPMGLDGPESAGRQHFNAVRTMSNQLLQIAADAKTKQFFVNLLAEVERATLAFARERVAECDLPSQKLVVLARR
jgi:SAM-dependent methyltransferase